MRYDVTQSGNDLIVSLSGRLSFSSFGAFAGLMRQLDGPCEPRVVFDLSSVDHLDSAGLGLLHIAREELGRRGVSVCLSSPVGGVRRLLELTDAESCFEIVN